MPCEDAMSLFIELSPKSHNGVNGKGIINLKDMEGEPVLIITFPVCFTVTKQNIIAALVGFV